MLKEVYEEIVPRGDINITDVSAHDGSGWGWWIVIPSAYFCKIHFNVVLSIPFNF
jgi:hypothetical protein